MKLGRNLFYAIYYRNKRVHEGVGREKVLLFDVEKKQFDLTRSFIRENFHDSQCEKRLFFSMYFVKGVLVRVRKKMIEFVSDSSDAVSAATREAKWLPSAYFSVVMGARKN